MPNSTVKVAGFKIIIDYFVRRLKTVFPHVAEKPLMLDNRRGNQRLPSASPRPIPKDTIGLTSRGLSSVSPARLISFRSDSSNC